MAALSLPWLVFTFYAALLGALRLVEQRPRPPPELAVAAGLPATSRQAAVSHQAASHSTTPTPRAERVIPTATSGTPVTTPAAASDAWRPGSARPASPVTTTRTKPARAPPAREQQPGAGLVEESRGGERAEEREKSRAGVAAAEDDEESEEAGAKEAELCGGWSALRVVVEERGLRLAFGRRRRPRALLALVAGVSLAAGMSLAAVYSLGLQLGRPRISNAAFRRPTG